MPGERRLPHAILNPVSEPMYSSIAQLVLDSIRSALSRPGMLIDNELRGLTATIASIGDAALTLAGDSFSTFYVSWPIVRRSKVNNVVIEALRKTLHYLVQTPEFQRIQATTRYSVAKSLVYGARLAINVLRAIMKNPQAYQLAAPEALAVPSDYLQRLQQRLSDVADRVARKAAKEALGDLKDKRLQQLAMELEELSQLLQQSQQRCGCRGGGYATAAITGQQQTTSDAAAVMPGGTMAGKAPGTLQTIAKIAVMAVANSDLQQIIVLGGQIEARFRFMRSQRRESRRGTVDGYSITANPAKALPREHALPTELWLAKLANGRWLTKRRVEEKLGMLIMALDKSGSMAGVKTIWSRSIAYALTKLALKRRQPVALIFFDFVPHGPFTDPQQILEALLTVPSDGGTNIDRALAAALELLRQHRDKTNTIVLITDGEDRVDTKPAELKKHGARLVAVMVKGKNPDLERLAKASGGQYLAAQLDERGALRVVDAAL